MTEFMSYQDYNHPIDEDTLDLFRAWKVRGLGMALKKVAEDPNFDDWSFVAKVNWAIADHKADVDQRRMERRLREAKFANPTAQLECIRWDPCRTGLTKNTIDRWALMLWVDAGSDIILVGPTGIGKSYIAQALGTKACQMGLSVRFISVSGLNFLIDELDQEGQLPNFHRELVKADLVIVDDLGHIQLTQQAATFLASVLAAREYKSTVVTSQYPLAQWGEMFCSSGQGEAIVRRLSDSGELAVLDGAVQLSDQRLIGDKDL